MQNTVDFIFQIHTSCKVQTCRSLPAAPSGEASLWRLGGYTLGSGSRKTFKTLFINSVGYLFRREYCLGSFLQSSVHIKAAHLSLPVCCLLVLELRGPFTSVKTLSWHVKTEILVLSRLPSPISFSWNVLCNLLQGWRRGGFPKVLFKFGIIITLDRCWKGLKSSQKLELWQS